MPGAIDLPMTASMTGPMTGPIPTSRRVTSDAVRLLTPRPVRSGQPLFIFLPGMDGTGTLLRSQLDRLVPWFDIRCVAISNQDNIDWEPLARQISDLIESALAADSSKNSGKNSSKKRAQPHPNPKEGASQGRRRAVYLCGESFGGCLAMQVLSLSPHLFDRVILVNPASSFRRLPWMQLGSMITRQLPDLAYRYSARGLVPFLIEANRVPKRDQVALEKAMGSVPAKTAAWRMLLLSRFEAERLPLERMNQPVLLIAGGQDKLLPSIREARSLQRRFPNAQLTILPNSGHACLLEWDVNLPKILRQHNFLDP